MEYVLGEIIHAGSETCVFAGHHRETEAPVVFKRTRSVVHAAKVLERLQHEKDILESLDGSMFLRPLGLFPSGESLALVFERWGEASLEQRLDEGPLPVATALHLGAALARTLGQVHRQGIIHRDVKPQNILVNAEQRELRLIDFGLATRQAGSAHRATSGDPEPRVANRGAGTLDYMAPEQTGRTALLVDTRTDLYALGATLYQMLTGALPFAMEDPAALMHAHIARIPEAPDARAPGQRIPAVVSALVLKLLAKSPDQRYQTAEGLAFDLERCAHTWEEDGAVPDFPLGARDFPDRVRDPSRLFGRTLELSILAGALARAARGEVVLALIAGPSGMGKSALVREFLADVRRSGGSFAQSKLAPMQRGLPLAGIAPALRALVRQRLAEPEEATARFREAVQTAAGPNARILLDLVPELGPLLKEPPPLLEVGPIEARARFSSTVRRFVRSLAAASPPLVLFLDDLQWADPPSLALLQEILVDPDLGHLLILGAYRDSEVDAAHPLQALAAAADAAGRSTKTVTLAPLGDEVIGDLVADLLEQPADEVDALAALVKAKTDGSPFFVVQFLRALHERRLLARDPLSGAFRWDALAIERASVTDNVGALLSAKIGELDPAARRALAVAACIGTSFEIALLAEAAGIDAEALGATLARLERAGLIAGEDEVRRSGGPHVHEGFAFVHDRVHQAAYEALEGDLDRLRTHLALGRVLARRLSALPDNVEPFTTLHHFLVALPALTDPDERRRVAALCLRGGQRARAGAAYAEAARFLRAGQELLGEAGWGVDFALTFDLALALADAAWLAGDPALAEPLFERCLERAPDPHTRGRVALTWMPLLLLAGRYQDVIARALAALEELGQSFPTEPAACDALSTACLERVGPQLMAFTPEAWRALPRCTDPTALMRGELFVLTCAAAAFVHPPLAKCINLASIEQTLTQGISFATPYATGGLALLQTLLAQEFDLGIRCIELTLAWKDMPDIARSSALFNACVAGYYLLPVAELSAMFPLLMERSEQEGDILYAELSRWFLNSTFLFRGVPLARCSLSERPARDAQIGALAAVHQAAHAALARDPQGYVDPQEQLAGVPASFTTFRAAILGYGALVALHLGEDERAAQLAFEAQPLWIATLGGTLCAFMELGLLTAGVTCLGSDPDRAAERQAQIAFHRGRLTRSVAVAPAALGHVARLADASEARAQGRYDEAARLYDEAIEDARRHESPGNEALALRLGGELLLARGQDRAARAYLEDAHHAYVRWGAFGAAARLRTRHAAQLTALLAKEAGLEGPRRRSSSTTSADQNALNARIDVTGVLRAAQALAEDVRIESLLERVMRVLAENAGARRAVLVLVREAAWHVHAELTVDPDRLLVALDETVEGSTRLPATLVQEAIRSREPLLLERAAQDPRFEGDPYLRAYDPASVMIVPLLHQGRALGAVYLEHPHVTGVFTEERLRVVHLLGAQAATAVENATLYAELLSTNERLERQVEERTVELRAAKRIAEEASRAKSDFLASMSHELRTPLNSVLGYSHLLERSAFLSAEDRARAQVIRRSGEHLLTLIDDVLDLAKIEAGKLELAPRSVNLPILLRTVIDMCRVRASQKGLAFWSELVGHAPESLRVDDKRLMQVLLNLLTNAIKFTAQGSVRLHVTIAPAPRSDDGAPPAHDLCLRVEDTGRGMNAEQQARVFEAFEQAGDAKSRAEGAGLGLAISRRIVEHMGGRIAVESELGRGSVFSVSLRLPEAGALAGGRDAGSWAEISGYEGERRLILVVDDHEDQAALARELLAPLGFAVELAADGEEALARAAEQRPALVVMDLSMPGMDGYETLARLRGLGEPQPIALAWSASVLEGVEQRTRSAGFDGFVPKPVEPAALLDAVGRSLGLSWVYRAARPSEEAPALPQAPRIVPPPDVVAVLREHASLGRLREVQREAERLGQEHPELLPWLTEVQDLARRFQVKLLRELLAEGASE